MKRDWTVGYLLCLSAGVTMLVAAFLPWGSTRGPLRMYTAIDLRFYEPFAFALLVGGTLVLFGWLRTSWAALAAMAGAFASGLVMLMIHGDLYGRLATVNAALGGDVGHPYGFGIAVFLAVGVLSFFAAVAISIESAPVVTK